MDFPGRSTSDSLLTCGITEIEPRTWFGIGRRCLRRYVEITGTIQFSSVPRGLEYAPSGTIALRRIGAAHRRRAAGFQRFPLGASTAGSVMSALWTPGRAGASPWVLRQCPAPPSQVCPHRLLPGACAGVRWSWFDSGPAQSWPESYLESACSTRVGIYWPRVVRTARRPHLPPVPPTLVQ